MSVTVTTQIYDTLSSNRVTVKIHRPLENLKVEGIKIIKKFTLIKSGTFVWGSNYIG